jgi:hypothetical protein
MGLCGAGRRCARRPPQCCRDRYGETSKVLEKKEEGPKARRWLRRWLRVCLLCVW